jgi:hypothetical protein
MIRRILEEVVDWLAALALLFGLLVVLVVADAVFNTPPPPERAAPIAREGVPP